MAEEEKKGRFAQVDVSHISPLWLNAYPDAPEQSNTWWGDVSDNLSLIYDPLRNKINRFHFPVDKDFNITPDMLHHHPSDLRIELANTKSLPEFDNTIFMYNHMKEIRERLGVNNRITSMLMAGLVDPINLIPLPGAFGMGFIKGFVKTGAAVAGLVGVQEAWRSHRDPTHQPIETAFAVTGGALFGGLLGGTIGRLTRGMDLKKIGDDFNSAVAFDEGNPLSKQSKRKIKGKPDKGQSKKMDHEAEEADSSGLDIPSPKSKKQMEAERKEIWKSIRLQSDDTITGKFRGKNIVIKEVTLEDGNKVLDVFIDGVLRPELRSKPHKSLKHWDIAVKQRIRAMVENENKFAVKKLKSKSVKKGEKETGEQPAGAFGFQHTMKFTLFGRLMTRFKSDLSSLTAQWMAGDYSVVTNSVKFLGGVAGKGKGSVVLKQAQWRHRTIVILRSMQDEWSKYYGDIKDPTRIVGMPITKWTLQARNIFKNKNGKIDFDEFATEVSRAMILASKETRKGIDFGEIRHSIPEVENVAKVIAKEFKTAAKEGEKVGIFRMENGIKKMMQKHFEYYKKWWFLWNDLDNKKKLTKGDKFRKQMLEAHLSKLLHDMEGLELYRINQEKVSRHYSVKLQELLDDISTKHQEADAKYIKLIEELRLKRANAKKKFDDLAEQIALQFENKKKILKQLNEDLFDRGLTKDQLLLRKELLEEISELYVGAGKGGTAKQKEFLALLAKEMNKRPTQKQVKYLNSLLDQIEAPVTMKQLKYIDTLQNKIDGKYFKGTLMPANEAHYFTRMWNEGAIRDNYDRFVAEIIIPHIKANPRGRLRRILNEKPKPNATKEQIERLELKKEDALLNKAKEITNRIIDETGNTNFDNMNGGGVARFMMQRELDIPNYKLLKEENGLGDFIELDSRAVTRAYYNKFGPAVEMSRQFDGDRFGEESIFSALWDVAVRYEPEINRGPQSFAKRLSDHEDDYLILRDAIMGRLGNPKTNGSASNQLVRGLMIVAQLTMMGKATIASLADPAKIILARGFNETFGRYVKNWSLDLKELKMAKLAKQDLLVSGEGLDVILNSARYRIMLDDALGNYGNRKLGKWGDKALAWLEDRSAGFYNLNLLNPWTDSWKGWVGLMSADRIIRSGSLLVKKGGKGLTKNQLLDIDILRQYGLSSDDLKLMYRHWAKANGQQSYRGKEIYYSNVQKWKDADPDLVRKYNQAVRADQINTIITPTEADKPALAFGIFGRGAQRRQHTLFKAPLQFMSWALAANNKILISSLQGRHKGVLSGMTAMFALGMFSDYLRNPTYWHRKGIEERIYRAVEYSGLTSYWLDINNAIEVMSDSSYGIRPFLGKENPFAGDLGDTISEPFGPIGSISNDIIKMLSDPNLSLDRRAGIIRRLVPYNNLFYADWLFRGAQRTITDVIDN